MDRSIRTVDDVLRLLDGLFAGDADRWTAEAAPWWDAFYADRAKGVPFFVARPDENLVSYVDRGLITGGRALDLGCGPGRNAIYLAAQGFDVDAVDLSAEAIGWAQDRAREATAESGARGGAGGGGEVGAEGGARGGAESGARGGGEGGARGEGEIRFHCGDAFVLAGTVLTGPYDLIYDSGCFHHLPPHRRVSYLALLERALAPGGFFGLSCFAAGAMGSELSDADFYHQARLHGGIAYTPESLRRIFGDLTEVELRRMIDEPPDSPRFGEPFLWTALFRREPGGVG